MSDKTDNQGNDDAKVGTAPCAVLATDGVHEIALPRKPRCEWVCHKTPSDDGSNDS